MRVKNKKNHLKLNLIPILDAIFIFIFFLLMSAQFIDIYEINTDVPIVSTNSKEKKKEPLNLTLFLNKDHIILSTGIVKKQIKKFRTSNLLELNTYLHNLKVKYPNEQSIILRPNNSYPYHEIIKVIDFVRESKDKKSKGFKLFEQVIFETLE